MTAATRIGPLEARFAELKAARVRYFVGGSGPPVVLVHGLGGAASNWGEVAARLVDGHRVIAPELPGHGGSSPLPAAPNLNPFAEAVVRVAEREAASPATIVGHSLGGLVALRAAVRYPDAVDGLVLAAAAGILSATRRAQVALEFASLVQPGKLLAPFRGRIARSPRLRALVFAHWAAADGAALSPAAAEGFLAGPALHTDTRSAMRAMVRDDPRLELDVVRCRALLVWGARDNQLSVENAFEYARRLRIPLRVIAGCGHLLIGERPDACAEAIADFVNEVDSPRRVN